MAIDNNAIYIYRFLSTVWDGLPTKDRVRFAELWKGYEQVLGESYQSLLELGFSNNIDTIPIYHIQRWERYTFKESLAVLEPITFLSRKSLFTPLDLSQNSWIRLRVLPPTELDPVLVPWTDIDCRGADPKKTAIDEIIAAINKAMGYEFATPQYNKTLIQLKAQETTPGTLIQITRYPGLQDGTTEILGIVSKDLPLETPDYPFKYKIASEVRKIPNLQNSIRNQNLLAFFVEGVDFHIDIEKSLIEFRTVPPETLWASTTYRDEKRLYNNYGASIGYWDSKQTPEEYAITVKALWYAYWHGPKPLFIQQALYLMFGLPVAKLDGIINRVTGSTYNNASSGVYAGVTFTADKVGIQGDSIQLVFDGVKDISHVLGVWNSANPSNTASADSPGDRVLQSGVLKLSGGSVAGQGFMEIIYIDGSVNAHALPTDLIWHPYLQPTSFVKQFQPLCNGIMVYDKVTLPNFVESEIGYGFMLDRYALPEATRGPGDTDETKAISMLQEHSYLPQIDVNAFVRPGINIGNVLKFLKNLQPLHKIFQLQVTLITADAKVTLLDGASWDLAIDVSPNLEINQFNSAPLGIKDDYELFGNLNPALDLDSDCAAITESGTIVVRDRFGATLPQYGVVWK